MIPAFIDTSALASILFREPGYPLVQSALAEIEKLHASNLLEAELRAAASREEAEPMDVNEILSSVEWVLPDRTLAPEIYSVIACGIPLKGADLWHLACALYLAGDPTALPFITLDKNQALAASRLGFRVLPEVPSTPGGAREPQAAYKMDKRQSKRKKRKPSHEQ